MERDALLAHGTSFLLQDRLMNCSDKTVVRIVLAYFPSVIDFLGRNLVSPSAFRSDSLLHSYCLRCHAIFRERLRDEPKERLFRRLTFRRTSQMSDLMTLFSPLGSGVYQVWQHTLPSPGQTCRWVGSCGSAQRTEVDLQNLWKQWTHSAVSFPLRLPLSCGRVGGHEYQDVLGSEKSWNLIVDEPAVQRGNVKNSHLRTAATGTAPKKWIQPSLNPVPNPRVWLWYCSATFQMQTSLTSSANSSGIFTGNCQGRHVYPNESSVALSR